MSAIKWTENIFAALRKMADKSRFRLELTKAEIDALVDNTTPRNTKMLQKFEKNNIAVSTNITKVTCFELKNSFPPQVNFYNCTNIQVFYNFGPSN